MRTKVKESPYQMYKDKPLVRCEDDLYYGCMADKYVVKISVKDKEIQNDMEIAKYLTVQLVTVKDGEVRQVVKTSEKGSLYEAIDIADVWLHRALEDDKEEK